MVQDHRMATVGLKAESSKIWVGQPYTRAMN